MCNIKEIKVFFKFALLGGNWMKNKKKVFNNIFVKYCCFELNEFDVNRKLRNIMSMSVLMHGQISVDGQSVTVNAC